ncbi:hypothetical protein K435DRAFT_621622, partial [Dendrothele bispora CBS 962.96]
MIGCALLAEVSNALSKATGINDLFGGLNVIFAGDLAQLPPVGYTRLYAKVNKYRSGTLPGQKDIFGKLAWLSVNTAVCLSEVKRCNNDPVFTGLLQRLRMGMVKPDWCSQEWSTAPLIVSENATKDTVNIHAAEAFARRTGRELHWYYATD